MIIFIDFVKPFSYHRDKFMPQGASVMQFKQANFKITGLLILFIMCLTQQIVADESENSNKIYEENKNSVFLVNQSIFIDESKLDHIDLFKKLELSMDKKVLNQYFPIANGTAFLINPDGYFITAAHVVKYIEQEKKFEAAPWIFEEYISKNAIPGYLTRQELRTVFKEYLKYMADAKIVISMKSIDRKDYVAEVIAQNNSLDLALLKIDLDKELTPLTISDEEMLKEGDQVFTIGYPLQFIMDSFLDDFKPTFTNGVISAIRTDKWDLQHTASINGGNSGGPLLSNKGELIGVNVGAITKANDIYFSTNASKIKKWLEDIDQADILDWNE